MKKAYRLIDIIDTFIPGDWGDETCSSDSPVEVSCIRGADIVPISNNEYCNIPTRYISERSSKSRLLQEGDIVIEKSGGSPTQSTGRVVYITGALLKERGNVVCSNFCAAFRIKKEWCPKYVFHFLQYVYDAGVFFNFEGKTSGLKNLDIESAFKAIQIERIPREEQAKKANAITLIEAKMALNRSINANLEAMAKQLYDYWFVQFDFPDENGRPYKSSGGKMVWNEKLKREIPEGWECRIYNDILAKYPTTKKYGTDEYLSNGLYPIIDQGPKYIVGWTNDKNTLLNRVPATLFGDHSTCVKLITKPFARGADGTQIIYSNCSRVLPYYLYECINHLIIPNPGYSRHFKYLKELPIVIPSQNIADVFEKICSPIFSKWSTNIYENEELLKQRDELLPLLMNGQVSITE